MTKDIVVFVEARYAEAAAIAGLVGPRPRVGAGWGYGPELPDGTYVVGEAGSTEALGTLRLDAARHLAYFDRRWVWGDLAAKRKILAAHACVEVEVADDELPLPRRICQCCETMWAGPWPCPTVRALAAPFASHPDFDPAWGQRDG
jgi:hypothetical protein